MNRTVLCLLFMLITQMLYAQLEPGTKHSVSGTVTFEKTNQPIENMFIHALNSFSHSQVASVQTREDGSFVINDLNPGNYIIEASGMIMDYPYTFQVYAKEYYPDQPDIDKATPVNVNQDVTGIDFQVSYGGGIRGRIIRQWDSQPIPHTRVGIKDTTDKFVVNAVTMTDKEGQFFISGLPKGFVGLLYATGETGADRWNAKSVYDPIYYPDAKSADGAQKLVLDSVLTDIEITLTGVVVSGKVTRQSDGQPIFGTEVELMYPSGSRVHPFPYTTDYSGNYLIGGVPPGTYYIRATGYTSQGAAKPYMEEYYDEVTTLQDATPLQLDYGETPHIDFSLSSGCKISGKVTHQLTGKPISLTEIDIYDAHWQPVGMAVTSSAGTYSFAGLQPGDYYARANGMVRSSDTGEPIKQFKTEYFRQAMDRQDAELIKVNGHTSDIDFTLEEGLTLSGRISNSGNRGLHGPQVIVYDPSWQVVATGFTGWQGEYTIGGLESGSTYIEILGTVYVGHELENRYITQYYPDAYSRADAQLFELTQNSQLNVTLVKGRTISGTVINKETGEPVRGAELELWNQNGEPIQGEQYYIRSDLDGAFSFTGLYPARYYIKATGRVEDPVTGHQMEYLSGFYKNATVLENADAIDVTEGDQTDLEFSLNPGLYITGSVIRASDGSPIANMHVLLLDAQFEHRQDQITNEQGEYRFDKLEPGAYYVFARGDVETREGPIKKYISLYYPGTTNRSDAELIQLTEKSIDNIDFTLQQGLSISGTLWDANDNSPLGNIRMDLLNDRFDWLYLTLSNQEGVYTFGGLESGTYYIYATGEIETPNGPVSEYINVYYPNERQMENAQPIRLEHSSISGIDFSLRKGLSISGSVKSAQDQIPIARARLSVYDDQFEWIGDTIADENGNYVFKSLPPGSYYIAANGGVETPNGPRQIYIPKYHPGTLERENAQTIELVDSPVTGIDFELEKGLSISGRVIDKTDNSPISRTRIDLLDEHFQWVWTLETDQEGQYSFGGLLPGSYYIRATGVVVTHNTEENKFVALYYNDTKERDKATAIPLTDKPVNDIDFILSTGAEISGRITDAKGNPIANMHVEAWDTTWNFISQISSDENGYYRLPGIGKGCYYIIATGNIQQDYFQLEMYRSTIYPGAEFAENAELICIQNDSTVIADIQMLTTYRVLGQLHRMDNGQPIPEAQIIVYNRDWQRISEAKSRDEGYFSVLLSDTGACYLEFSGKIWWNYGDYGDWNPLYHCMYYPGVYERSQAEIIKVSDHSDHLHMVLKDINVHVAPEKQAVLPSCSGLRQNYPNPFNPSTIIPFALSKSANVHLNIYNLQGQHVKTLFSGWRKAGEHRETWWGKDSRGKIVTQGIYFVVFETEAVRDIKRIVFIK